MRTHSTNAKYNIGAEALTEWIVWSICGLQWSFHSFMWSSNLKKKKKKKPIP